PAPAGRLAGPRRRHQGSVRAAHVRLPRLPRLRDRLPVRSGVRQAHGGGALANRGRAAAVVLRTADPAGRVPRPAAPAGGPTRLRAVLGALEAPRCGGRATRDREARRRRTTPGRPAGARPRSRVLAPAPPRVSRPGGPPRPRCV